VLRLADRAGILYIEMRLCLGQTHGDGQVASMWIN
jgi:hypothetical protein